MRGEGGVARCSRSGGDPFEHRPIGTDLGGQLRSAPGVLALVGSRPATFDLRRHGRRTASRASSNTCARAGGSMRGGQALALGVGALGTVVAALLHTRRLCGHLGLDGPLTLGHERVAPVALGEDALLTDGPAPDGARASRARPHATGSGHGHAVERRPGTWPRPRPPMYPRRMGAFDQPRGRSLAAADVSGSAVRGLPSASRPAVGPILGGAVSVIVGHQRAPPVLAPVRSSNPEAASRTVDDRRRQAGR